MQPRARADTLAPLDFGPLCSATPRTTLLAATRQAALAANSAPARALLAAHRRPQHALPRSVPPKLPALASCPLEHLQLIRSLIT